MLCVSTGACADGSPTHRTIPSFLGYEISFDACNPDNDGYSDSGTPQYSTWDWPYTIGTVAFRCFVDARAPMVYSVFATIAAMVAKELTGILIVIAMPRDAYADILDVAADSIISATQEMNLNLHSNSHPQLHSCLPLRRPQKGTPCQFTAGREKTPAVRSRTRGARRVRRGPLPVNRARARAVAAAAAAAVVRGPR